MRNTTETVLTSPVVCPVVVGRAIELTGLHTLIEQTHSGQGQIALLSGEAGIGKSRLVAEAKAVASAQGFQILEGACFPTDRSCPYAPLFDLLRTLLATSARERILAELGPLVATLFPLLPDLLPPPSGSTPLPALDAEQEQRRLFAALANVFISQASNQAVLLVVEDLHWSDESSLEFLHYLARRSPAHRLLLLLTYRSEDVHPALQHLLAQLDRERRVREYILARLNRAEVEAMLQAILRAQREVPGDLLKQLYSLTDGNPFFLEEVLKSWLTSEGLPITERGRTQALPSVSADRQFAIPRSVQEAVQQRVERISPKARRLLTLAAVAGRRFDASVLQHLLRCRTSQMNALLKEVVAAQLVVEESAEQFAFRHALTRQAIYAALLTRERRALHRRLAQTLERIFAAPAAQEAHLADLAEHWYQGAGWEQACTYSQRAGERALTLYAPRAALEQLTRAAQAAAQLADPPPATLYRARGQAYELLGEFERARADYEQALRLAQGQHDAQMEWQELSDLGFLWASRNYRQAGQWFRRALDFAERLGDPRLRASSLNRLGNWLVNTGQAAEGMHAHEQAMEVFAAQQDQQGMAETLDLLGTANALAGDLVSAVSQWGQASELFRAAGDIRSLARSLAMQVAFSIPTECSTRFSPLRAREVCIQEAEQALHLARQAESPGDVAFAELIVAILYTSFGTFGLALEHGQEAYRVATEVGHQQWTAGASCVLGTHYVLLLAPALALEALETALPLARELGSEYWTNQATTFLARAYLLMHDLERAAAVLAAVLPREQRPRSAGERRVHLVWGELALAQGQPEMALRIAEGLLETVPGAAQAPGGQPIPWLLTLQGEALLALGRVEEAILALEGAKLGTLERHERSRLWYVQGRLGRAYHRAGQEEHARREWLAARTVITQLAATVDEPTLCDQFTQAALAIFWPGEPSLTRHLLEADLYGGLTGREREVAALIAQGKSNREIADTLVVHYRTVETHVSHILSKLGFTSRAQIAVWATEHGFLK